MRLLQLLALAAFALLSIKLISLAATGAFDEIAIGQARAQDAKTADAAKADETSGEKSQSVNSRIEILARLGERRDELDKRDQDLKLREELLQAAEKRLKAKLAEIEKFEKTKKEGGKGVKDSARDLVIIYESMKPKDAARIFNSLSLNILHQLATSMNPKKMSPILAEMDVKAAERLTVEMAARSASNSGVKAKRKLSKIGG